MVRVYPHYSDFKGHWPWKNFTPEEISCNHCGELFIDHKSMDTLQRLRSGWGPIPLSSAHRCTVHNTKVGGAPQSMHLRLAFDCPMPSSLHLDFVKAAKIAGFTGTIRYPRKGFVHLDCRDKPYHGVG